MSDSRTIEVESWLRSLVLGRRNSLPPKFIAQGDRVLVVGFATGTIKATNQTFEDHWVFDITVRNGKLTYVREYVDTQALARASESDATAITDPARALL